MDGENTGKPYFLMDDLGRKPTIFGHIQQIIESKQVWRAIVFDVGTCFNLSFFKSGVVTSPSPRIPWIPVDRNFTNQGWSCRSKLNFRNQKCMVLLVGLRLQIDCFLNEIDMLLWGGTVSKLVAPKIRPCETLKMGILFLVEKRVIVKKPWCCGAADHTCIY